MVQRLARHDELPIEIVSDFTGSAPVDLDGLSRALGVGVRYETFDDTDIAGKIEKRGQRYVITINSDDPPRRQRFTLAHEIAHFLMHKSLIGDGVTDKGLYRSRLSGAIERQANLFAADLLMPKSLFRSLYLGGERSVSGLARRFNVSEDTIRIRLDELGLGP